MAVSAMSVANPAAKPMMYVMMVVMFLHSK